MLKLRMLAVAGLFVLSACTSAEPVPMAESVPPAPAQTAQCKAADEFAGDIMMANPAVRGLEIISGGALAGFITTFRAALDAPETQIDADRVIVLTHPDAPSHLAIFAKRGCVIGTAQIEKRTYQLMRRAAL